MNPFYGSPEVQSQISGSFNERLKAYCEDKGYKFIDIYDKFSDEYGFMLNEYRGYNVHLNKKVVGLVRTEMMKKKIRVNLQGELGQ